MRNRYRTLPMLVPMLMAFAAAPAFAASSPAPANSSNAPAGTDQQAVNAAQQPAGRQPDSDAQFAKDASAGNMAEVKLGNLAMQRGATPAVREFGRWMATDHQMAETILQATAQKANIPLSTGLMPEQQAMLTKLQGQNGRQFDRDYIDGMVKDHQATLAKFKDEAQSGKNDALKQYAEKLAPVLQQHLDEAQELQRNGPTGDEAMNRIAMSGSGEHATSAGDRAVDRLNANELKKVENRQP